MRHAVSRLGAEPAQAAVPWVHSWAPLRRSSNMRPPCGLVLTLAAVTLLACREDPPQERGAATDPRLQAAHEVAEARLRERLRATGGQQSRGVQAFAQAIPNTFAVCGRVSGSASEPLLPWVAVVNAEAGAPQVTSFVLGASGPEATRVFTEMVDRCFEGGGPPVGRTAARPLPPLPTQAVPEAPPATASNAPASASPASTAAPTTAAAAAPSVRSVVTSARNGANLRSSPQGGQVLRVVPRSSTLQVFGEAPGGWYQVGQNGTAWGWIHSSVLERTDR